MSPATTAATTTIDSNVASASTRSSSRNLSLPASLMYIPRSSSSIQRFLQQLDELQASQINRPVAKQQGRKDGVQMKEDSAPNSSSSFSSSSTCSSSAPFPFFLNRDYLPRFSSRIGLLPTDLSSSSSSLSSSPLPSSTSLNVRSRPAGVGIAGRNVKKRLKRVVQAGERGEEREQQESKRRDRVRSWREFEEEERREGNEQEKSKWKEKDADLEWLSSPSLATLQHVLNEATVMGVKNEELKKKEQEERKRKRLQLQKEREKTKGPVQTIPERVDSASELKDSSVAETRKENSEEIITKDQDQNGDAFLPFPLPRPPVQFDWSALLSCGVLIEEFIQLELEKIFHLRMSTYQQQDHQHHYERSSDGILFRSIPPFEKEKEEKGSSTSESEETDVAEEATPATAREQ